MLLLPFLLAALTAAPAPTQPLWVELGPTNRAQGLTIPNGGDGENVPESLAGRACRRIAGGKSLYLYVQADDARVPAGRYDAYLTVEYFDRELGVAHVQYDRAVEGGQASAYSGAEDVIFMAGTGQWQRAVLRLPDARFGNRQNFGADLRLCSSNLAVSRLEISFQPPADYKPGGINPAMLEKVRARIGSGVELTFGNDAGPGQAQLFRALGVTSVESYVTWQTVEDAAKGQWDWSRWDRQVEVLQKAGLKWVPFVIAGPAYANPKWFRESDQSAPYVCLEHGKPSKVESLWNPQMRPMVDRFLQAFTARYGDKGVIESVLLGVTGIYGESIYPAGPEGGWTAGIPGPYHNHAGWWAGDRYAAEDFRRYLRKRYADVGALNRAWGTQHTAFEQIAPFIPDKAPSPRARLDMTDWYVGSMTDWSVFWVATTRKYLPKTEIYLCTGGAGEPVLGADFSAQTRAIAPYGAGVRITNEASNYASNFVITREVATACRAFDTYFGFEPASRVDANGVVARIYNATASGALQLHYYTSNVTESAASLGNFRRYASFLERRAPRIPAGIYLPKTSWALDPGSARRIYDMAREMRDRVDLEFVDRSTLGSARLREMRVLAVPEAAFVEESELAALRQWVVGGGILVALVDPTQPLLRTPEGSDAARNALLATPPAGLEILTASASGKPPRRFHLAVGQGADTSYLLGDWYGQESGREFPDVPGATKRWSGGRAGFYLPCDPAQDATLILDAHLSGHSLPGANRVLVNGKQVGLLDKPGTHTYRFPVPRTALAGGTLAEVVLEVRTWKPSDHGSSDSRPLGAAVRAVELCAVGAESEAPASASLRRDLKWDLVTRHCLRRVGQGATLAIPARRGDAASLSEVVVQALTQTERLVGRKGIALPSPDGDGVYATQVKDGVLYYNSRPEAHPIGKLVVPAHGIAWEPAR